jgi:hypothetical protein
MLEANLCRKKLLGFVDQVCKGQSPLYETVCRTMCEDDSLLEIMAHTPPAQPGPILFLAAVHYLLLQGAEHELRKFYGTCTAVPRPASAAWPAFREFCRSRRESIIHILETRGVQTNEVRRCAYWFPALSIVSVRHHQPMAVIEIGASAGLNLNWDRYAYDYGDHGRFGRDNATVVIAAEWRGRGPNLPQAFPSVVHRLGVDLHPVDVKNPGEALWLQSLLWPDQPDRFRLQAAAVAEFRRSPVPLVSGSAVDMLPAAIRNVPVETYLCLVHTHTLNQFSVPERAALQQILREASQQRPLSVISAEWIQTPQTELRLTDWRVGSDTSERLAQVDHHGRWLEWDF